MLKIDNDTIFECTVCKKPIDMEDPWNKQHEDHFDEVCHDLDMDDGCSMCLDEPIHCQWYMEGAIDRAKAIAKDEGNWPPRLNK